ncbi:PPE domain-containing protein [Saccharopolyspora rhizosphaerae]|uniref:PPE domain-containing protein n=1 Tax=Saccharopolyspora rhizosphaerae TaxID=2492662 RepID=A0A3R8P4C9_9PSEU|nr:PPE domain-containing protein [Saccharopolyspora rhizosphaerae]RRO16241.1 PPE domain-containing protein [Saccharopolyspora rhizosphaerae]
MTYIDPLRDIRFQGMDIPELQEWIAQIKQGQGTQAMQGAVRALDKCVQVVVDLDDTLRRELAKLQVEWHGSAGSLAAEATRQQSVALGDAPDPLAVSASSVAAQAGGYESARHTLPNPDELGHEQSENVFEWAGGGFGYESDYDQEAKQIEAQKRAAQAALSNYRDTSVEQAQTYQPLPSMPAAAVVPAAPPGSTPSAGIGSFGSTPGGSAGEGTGAVVGGTAGGGQPRGDRHAPPKLPAAPPPAGQRPGGRPDEQPRPDEQQPDEHAAEFGTEPDPQAGQSTGDGLGTGTVLGIAAGGAAVAGIGAYAASKFVGGRTPATATGPGVVPGAGESKTPANPRGGSVGGGPGDTVAGKAAGGTPGSRPAPGSVMSPAATRGDKPGEDTEHENKYTAEETPFDDDRLVAPAVLGHVEPEAEEVEPEAEEAEPTGDDADGDEPEKQG